VGVAGLIQITPQLRILVAIEAIDGRKGIDSLVQLCREKLDADPFSGCLLSLVADGPGSSENVACPSGADAAGRGRSGRAGSAGLAWCERIENRLRAFSWYISPSPVTVLPRYRHSTGIC